MTGLFLEKTLRLKLICDLLISIPTEGCRASTSSTRSHEHCHLEKKEPVILFKQLRHILCVGKYLALRAADITDALLKQVLS